VDGWIDGWLWMLASDKGSSGVEVTAHMYLYMYVYIYIYIYIFVQRAAHTPPGVLNKAYGSMAIVKIMCVQQKPNSHKHVPEWMPPGMVFEHVF
jgi:hypothetical protein